MPADGGKAPGKSPLLNLKEEFHCSYPAANLPVVATQLGLLPDLRYLEEGLQRSRTSISAFSSELAECLRAVPGNRFEPDRLLQSIDELLVWIGHQGWGLDDPRRLPMENPEGVRKHPLDGYCLTVSFHWPNLFYAPEPDPLAISEAMTIETQFADLMSEFSAYVIAAQSTIDPDIYMAYCEKWCIKKQLPGPAPYPEKRVFNRIAHASRVMRRLTLTENRPLLLALVEDASKAPFHERLSRILRPGWEKHEQEALDAIARFLEEVRLGWQRPQSSPSKAGAKSRTVSKGVTQKQFRDGFVRMSGQHAMMMRESTGEGWEIQSVTPQPATIETLAQEFLLAWNEDTASFPDDENSATVADQDSELALMRERALADATALLDGQEWIPAYEAGGAECIEAIYLPEADGEESAVSPAKARGGAEHIRRFRFSHGLTKDRLTLRTARDILRCLPHEPSDSPHRESLLRLHASLALGRSLEDTFGLQIHVEKPPVGYEIDRIHYVLKERLWLLPCPAAAWLDLPQTAQERPQWPQLWLKDWTGFGTLLEHFEMADKRELAQKLVRSRLEGINDFLQRAVPRAKVTVQQCARFLFRQLLETASGDLGLASLITAHHHGHSSSVGHYANYRAENVWAAYRQAWHPPTAPVNRRPVAPTEGGGGYGSRRVPRLNAVIDLFAHLRLLVRSGDPIARHNSYTAFTFAALVLGLGMRPVVAPRIDSPAHIRGAPAMLGFVDKARSDYDRRINPMPRSLERHLTHYVAYVSTHGVGLPQGGSPIPLIYLDPQTGEPERFRPTHFLTIARPAFELELYALRRFARTHLREVHQVTGEDMDAWMGHWLYRVSPHDRLSTYPMRRLWELVEGPVEAMLREVGFKPLRGNP